MSGDGSTVVGECAGSFLWNATLGPVNLATYLSVRGVSTDGWTLQGAEAISFDGLTIAGYCSRAGAIQGYIIDLHPVCGTADFNGDGDVGTDADIEAFFACLAGNCCATCGPADFNGDGDTGTDADIESFFRVLAGGVC